MYDSIDENIITMLPPNEKKTVMLTFDDGPGRALPRILEILHQEEVKAAFFWQSRLLHHQRPWKEVIKAGHIIGSHSCKHRNLSRLSFQEQHSDLSRCKETIQKIIGQPINYFRPPFGQYNGDTLRAARELGMQVVMWRIASLDWELKADPPKIVDYVIDNLEDRAILLLHELPQTVEILPLLISQIKQAGYQFGLLD
ncbi:polysaccharide deacetylase family protein [Bacillus sp. P14.5]|uniref:polysaccharide deacetylase family protein n=1 Tax=Bacillus sp. P14.5 TaxID=1983400 RepID=UPI001F06A173|nr:polysaccharide deacetylase family protein [Bacillus sp. P14.5]